MEWLAQIKAGEVVGSVALTVFTDGTIRIHRFGIFESSSQIDQMLERFIASRK